MNQRIRQKPGFYLPNAARDDDYNTKTGKANFAMSVMEPIHLETGQFLMTTLRSHDQ
jgi:hypothetical protein